MTDKAIWKRALNTKLETVCYLLSAAVAYCILKIHCYGRFLKFYINDNTLINAKLHQRDCVKTCKKVVYIDTYLFLSTLLVTTSSLLDELDLFRFRRSSSLKRI